MIPRAQDRRHTDPPDLVLGHLALWIGTGENQSFPWIELAVRVGEGWTLVADCFGPMVKRPDLIAFLEALPALAAGMRDDAVLGSVGGSLQLILRRDQHNWMSGEARFDRRPVGHTVTFSLWDASLQAAAAAAPALAAAQRDTRYDWTPDPARAGLAPLRDSGVAHPSEERRVFEPWDAGLNASDAVSFEYIIDGYGWYSGIVKVGDQRGDFGGTYETDLLGDFLRAGLAMLAGADRADVHSSIEPRGQLTRFERVTLGSELDPWGRPIHRSGCRITLHDLDDGPAGTRLEFDAVAASPRLVAEAIYRMALPHFEQGAAGWTAPMAALEAALKAVPKD